MDKRCGTCKWWNKFWPDVYDQAESLQRALEDAKALKTEKISIEHVMLSNIGHTALRTMLRMQDRGECRHGPPPWPQSEVNDWCGRWAAKDPDAIHYARTQPGAEAATTPGPQAAGDERSP